MTEQEAHARIGIPVYELRYRPPRIVKRVPDRIVKGYVHDTYKPADNQGVITQYYETYCEARAALIGALSKAVKFAEEEIEAAKSDHDGAIQDLHAAAALPGIEPTS